MAIELSSHYEQNFHAAQPESLALLPSQFIIPELSRLPYFSLDQIILVANGIDVKCIEPLHDNTDYEEKCFASIVSPSINSVILGPHLLDRLFPFTSIGSLRRPDAIELDTTVPNNWVFTHLYEFKVNCKSRKEATKLNGFSILIEKLRDDETYLPLLLQHSLPHILPIPNRFTVPPNEAINVTFISPNGKERFRAKTDFKLHN